MVEKAWPQEPKEAGFLVSTVKKQRMDRDCKAVQAPDYPLWRLPQERLHLLKSQRSSLAGDQMLNFPSSVSVKWVKVNTRM